MSDKYFNMIKKVQMSYLCKMGNRGCIKELGKKEFEKGIGVEPKII